MRRWMQPRKSVPRSYAVKLGPPALQGLATWLGLPEHLVSAWWRGVCHASWSEVAAWRQAEMSC